MLKTRNINKVGQIQIQDHTDYFDSQYNNLRTIFRKRTQLKKTDENNKTVLSESTNMVGDGNAGKHHKTLDNSYVMNKAKNNIVAKRDSSLNEQQDYLKKEVMSKENKQRYEVTTNKYSTLLCKEIRRINQELSKSRQVTNQRYIYAAAANNNQYTQQDEVPQHHQQRDLSFEVAQKRTVANSNERVGRAKLQPTQNRNGQQQQKSTDTCSTRITGQTSFRGDTAHQNSRLQSGRSKNSQQQRVVNLIHEDQAQFVSVYEDTIISNYMQSNSSEDHYNLRERHPEIDELLRAKLIDWVQHCTNVCQMEEKNIFFIVVNLIDTYYKKVEQPQPKADVQLTAVAALFLASKLLQIRHINLQFCIENLGHNKYTQEQVIERETELLQIAEWNFSMEPTIYEYFELLILMLKNRLQQKCTNAKVSDFMKDLQILAFKLLKASTCSMETMKYNLFERTASLIQIALGFTLIEFQVVEKDFIEEGYKVMNEWKAIVEEKWGSQLTHLKGIGYGITMDIMKVDRDTRNRLVDIMTFSQVFRNWIFKYEQKRKQSLEIFVQVD